MAEPSRLIRLQTEPFDTHSVQEALTQGRKDLGALVTFQGLVRELIPGARDQSLSLQHYPGMTDKALHNLADEALHRWPLLGLALIHRYGRLEPGEGIVLVITASAHRAAAFESASYLMDQLKSRVPLWKYEEADGKGAWVEARASDTEALSRWQSR